MSLWRTVIASNYIVPYSFSLAATGAAVANRWSAGRRGPYVIGPARPKAATPGNRGLPWRAAADRKAPPKGVSQTPEAPPGAPSPVGETEKRDRARPSPQPNWAGEALAKRVGCTYKTATDSRED